MDLWTKELKRSDSRKVDKHEGYLIDNETLISYAPPEESGKGSNGEYMTRSEVERIIEDNIKTTVEVATRNVVAGIGEETIDYAFTVRYDEQREGIITPIRNRVEWDLIRTVEQGPCINVLCTTWISRSGPLGLWTSWSDEYSKYVHYYPIRGGF